MHTPFELRRKIIKSQKFSFSKSLSLKKNDFSNQIISEKLEKFDQKIKKITENCLNHSEVVEKFKEEINRAISQEKYQAFGFKKLSNYRLSICKKNIKTEIFKKDKLKQTQRSTSESSRRQKEKKIKQKDIILEIGKHKLQRIFDQIKSSKSAIEDFHCPEFVVGKCQLNRYKIQQKECHEIFKPSSIHQCSTCFKTKINQASKIINRIENDLKYEMSEHKNIVIIEHKQCLIENKIIHRKQPRESPSDEQNPLKEGSQIFLNSHNFVNFMKESKWNKQNHRYIHNRNSFHKNLSEKNQNPENFGNSLCLCERNTNGNGNQTTSVNQWNVDNKPYRFKTNKNLKAEKLSGWETKEEDSDFQNESNF